MKSNRFHYAWLILLALCFSQGAVVGIVNNCAGLFYSPVSKDLGCSIASVSLATTITSVSTCLFLLTVSKKLLLKYKIKYVLLIANLLLSLRIILAFTDSIVLWWIIGALSGMSSSMLCGLTTSVVLERWFAKKLPTALSIAASFSGILGIVMSYLIGSFIEGYGWRTALVVSTVIVSVLILPTWILTLNPCEKGKIPYGMTSEAYQKQSGSLQTPGQANGKKIRLDFRLVYVVVLFILNASLTAFIAHLATFGLSKNVPYDSAWVVTLYMCGNLLFKLLYGWCVERFGLKPSSIGAMCIVVSGLLLLLLTSDSLLLVGAFLFGGSALVYTTMNPLIERFLYSSEEYPSIVPIGFGAYMIFFAAFGYLYGAVYDAFSNYNVVLLGMTLAAVVNAVLIPVVLRKKNEPREG